MGKPDPIRCEVCGLELNPSGSTDAPLAGAPKGLWVQVSDFGAAEVRGDVCSMQHAAEWLAGGPELKPYKHPWMPLNRPAKIHGCGIMLAILFVLACVVLGFIAMVRILI